MKRRAAGVVFGALSLLFVAAAPASATESTNAMATSAPAASASTDQYPPGCFGERYGIVFGQGVAVNCGFGVEGGYGYQVVAHCSAGGAFWYARGSFVPFDFGPSVAECNGGLLDPAFVSGYHVVFR